MDPSFPILNRSRHRVAILIDGDNFPHSSLKTLEDSAIKWGVVTIRRVFGDMTLQKAWSTEKSYTVTHCTTSAGKNRADMALVVAAMDFANRGLATVFVIVSDDRDFGPLVSHLCEQGYRVEWIGKPSNTAVQKAGSAVKPAPCPTDPLLPKVRKIVAAHTDGLPIQALGPAGQKEGIKISQTPQKSWRNWLVAYSDDFICDPRGPNARVRLKS